MDKSGPVARSLTAAAAAWADGAVSRRFLPSALCSTEERNEINRIVLTLYLTSFEGAENADELKRIKATHIVAVGREFMDNTKNQAVALGVKFYNLDITDKESQSGAMGAALRNAANFIRDALKQKKARVVVHCAAGESRSPTVVIAYLMAYQQFDLRNAFECVPNRLGVWPNAGFMQELIEFEQKTRRQKDKHKPSSIDIADYMHWCEYEGPSQGDELHDDPFYQALSMEARQIPPRRVRSAIALASGARPSRADTGVCARPMQVRRPTSFLDGDRTYCGYNEHSRRLVRSDTSAVQKDKEGSGKPRRTRRSCEGPLRPHSSGCELLPKWRHPPARERSYSTGTAQLLVRS